MKHPFIITLFFVIATPTIASAQSIQQYIVDTGGFINTTIIPVLFALAFLFFAWNAVRYFILEGDNEKAQENARAQTTYGVTAFVIIISIWGIVNLLAGSFGFSGENTPCPDYINPIGTGPCLSLPTTERQFTPFDTNSPNPKTPAAPDPVADPVVLPAKSESISIAMTALEPTTSCTNFISQTVRFYLTDPALTELQQLEYAKAFVDRGLIPNESFTNLLALYNQQSSAGLLASGIASLSQDSQFITDTLMTMNGHLQFIKNQIDQEFLLAGFSGTEVNVFCDLFEISKTTASRPTNTSLTNNLWDDIRLRYTDYQQLRGQIE